MRKVFLFTVFFLVGIIFAQENSESLVISTQKLAGGDGVVFTNPRWSPDGTKIAITGPNYVSLFVMNSDGTNLRRVSNEMGAGYNVKWSPDSRFISVTVARYDGGKRKEALKLFDLELGTSRMISDYAKPSVLRLHAIDTSNNLVISEAGAVKRINTGDEATQQTKTAEIDSKLICLVEGTNFSIYDPQTGVVERMNPIPGAKYLTPVLSPDQNYVVFKVYGGEMQVLNIRTKQLTNLGAGHHPRWSADSRWIVFERNTDDGHQLTSADLYLVDRITQNEHQLLQTPDVLEVNPDWSPVANEILYENMTTGEINKVVLKALP